MQEPDIARHMCEDTRPEAGWFTRFGANSLNWLQFWELSRQIHRCVLGRRFNRRYFGNIPKSCAEWQLRLKSKSKRPLCRIVIKLSSSQVYGSALGIMVTIGMKMQVYFDSRLQSPRYFVRACSEVLLLTIPLCIESTVKKERSNTQPLTTNEIEQQLAWAKQALHERIQVRRCEPSNLQTDARGGTDDNARNFFCYSSCYMWSYTRSNNRYPRQFIIVFVQRKMINQNHADIRANVETPFQILRQQQREQEWFIWHHVGITKSGCLKFIDDSFVH